jgi:hypothetical protein
MRANEISLAKRRPELDHVRNLSFLYAVFNGTNVCGETIGSKSPSAAILTVSFNTWSTTVTHTIDA